MKHKQKLYILSILCLCIMSRINAQISGIYGSDTITSSVARDYINDIEFDDHGNMYVVGRTDRLVGSTIYYYTPILKFNPQGQLVQSIKTTIAETFSIKKVSDGNLVVCGTGNGLLCNTVCKKDMWVVKIDTSANFLWGRSFGNIINDGNDIAYDIAEDASGNIIVTGQVYITGYDVRTFLCSLNQQGDTLWTRVYGMNSGWQTGKCVAVSSTGNIYMGGSGLNSGPLLTKHSSNGDLLWAKAYSSGFGTIFGIYEQNNGSLTLAAENIVSGNNVLCVFNVNADGTLNWSKKITLNDANRKIYTRGTWEDASGNIYFAGYHYDGINYTGYTPYLIKLDASANLIWAKHYTDGYGKGSVLTTHPTQGIVFGGEHISNEMTQWWSHQPEFWLIHMDDNGQTDCFSDMPVTIQNHTLAPLTKSFTRFFNYTSAIPLPSSGLLDVYKKPTCSNTLGISQHEEVQFEIYPNPATSQIKIKATPILFGSSYKIYDQLGQVILKGILSDENTTIDLGNLSGGIYLFSVGENLKQKFKVIKE